MEQYLIIGQIVNTHGVKGEMKVLPLTDDVTRFKKLKNIYVEKNNKLSVYNVSLVKFLNNFVIVKLDGIDEMNAAESFKQCYIKINRQDAVKLPKDAFYISDLIGMNVITDEGESLGVIKDILQTGANDNYIVGYNGREFLIPALKEVVQKVDLENNTMTVKLLEGLKDI